MPFGLQHLEGTTAADGRAAVLCDIHKLDTVFWWTYPLMARGYHIYCGFDNDQPGEAASCRKITRHASIKRLRPPANDWNDGLTASH